MLRERSIGMVPLAVGIALVAGFALAADRSRAFTLPDVLGYPYPAVLAAAPNGRALAWVLDERGVRNVFVAEGPAYRMREITHFAADDGREITDLTFSRDGRYLVFVRGGDHDANWPEDHEPDPDASPVRATMQVWSVALQGGQPHVLGDGDAPDISPDGTRVAFLHLPESAVWSAPIDASRTATPLFYDIGRDSDLHWSPEGRALAFVSARGDHGFIGVYRGGSAALEYLAPSTSIDLEPRWSPDGTRIAFARTPGTGGPPVSILERHPVPWSIWVAQLSSGAAKAVWRSPDTLRGSFPTEGGDVDLAWTEGDRIAFLAEMDDWPHLYVVPAAGGAARLLTPGAFMIEDVAISPDRRSFVYSANTGDESGDVDRRHLFRVAVDGGAPVEITHGTDSEWGAVFTGGGRTLAFVRAGARRPPLVVIGDLEDRHWRELDADRLPRDFPLADLVAPQSVAFRASDGLTIHGQLFETPGGGARKPGVIFVHGGPMRQMLLTWHNMDYYANAYAVNQYLAAHGFIVLSVNYRLGIGYGHDFHYPALWGPTGAAEYKDVLAGAHFLRQDPRVDAARIGIWGGSYGGYLTALALARNSDVFKAGVDLHGVHDWSMFVDDWFGKPVRRYQMQDTRAVMKVFWNSSPDASVSTWKSPVLLIQGDDDRNVHFHQMVDLTRRLDLAGVPYEQLVIPNEIHGFLRYDSWLRADEATAEFLARKLRSATLGRHRTADGPDPGNRDLTRARRISAPQSRQYDAAFAKDGLP